MTSGSAFGAALLSSICFGSALVTAKHGLRFLDARSGAAVSIPTATLVFALAAPIAFDASRFSIAAALLFALVGLFFPAVVTLLTFRANDRLGPAVTGTVSCTAPLFALAAAALLLGERIPARALVATLGVVAGVGALSWSAGAARGAPLGRDLLLPVAGAALRGLAQATAKAALALWPSPFAAGLISYVVSSATVLAVDRLTRRERRRRTRAALAWFALTGLLNGAAVLLLYAALGAAPVSSVAPLVATYPLFTMVLAALVLREEPLGLRGAAGAAITVASVAYLVSG